MKLCVVSTVFPVSHFTTNLALGWLDAGAAVCGRAEERFETV